MKKSIKIFIGIEVAIVILVTSLLIKKMFDGVKSSTKEVIIISKKCSSSNLKENKIIISFQGRNYTITEINNNYCAFLNVNDKIEAIYFKNKDLFKLKK